MNNWLKVYVVDVIPCLTIALYVLGIIYNLSYFSFWGINILHYISFGELLIEIIEPLVIISLLSLSCFIGMSYYSNYVSDLKKSLRERKKSVKDGGTPINNLADGYVDLLLRINFFHKYVYPKLKSFYNVDQKNEEKDDKKKTSGYSLFVLSLTICLIIAFVYTYIEPIPGRCGMIRATAALTFLTTIFLLLIMPKRGWTENAKDSLTKYNSMEIASSFFIFYITTMFIFYKAGKEAAEYNKNYDKVSFVINSNEGTKYDNHSYLFIEQLDEDVFLYEKETSDVIILNKENIGCIKMNYKHSKRTISILDDFLNVSEKDD